METVPKTKTVVRELGSVLNQLIILYDERLTIPVNRKQDDYIKHISSCLHLIPSAFIVFPEIPRILMRCGLSSHEKGFDAVICAAKNFKIHV